MLQLIKSSKNEKIKKLTQLLKSKKSQNLNDSFVLEGFRSVHDALTFKAEIESIFLTPSALKKFELINPELIKRCKLNLIDNDISQKLSSVKNCQGIFAIVKKLNQLNLSEIDSTDNVLVLVELSDPGNMGTLIRSASAFGYNKIILVDCCDIYNPKVVRSTMSSIFRTRYRQCSTDEAIAWLKNSNLKIYAAVADKHKPSSFEPNLDMGCVLMIGNEAHGIPAPILDLCSKKITIKMLNEIESLNAAVAGSILMFNISNKINKIGFIPNE